MPSKNKKRTQKELNVMFNGDIGCICGMNATGVVGVRMVVFAGEYAMSSRGGEKVPLVPILTLPL